MLPQDLILDHYHHPKNFGLLPNATRHAETENLSCGDSLAVDIIVKDDKIERIGWTGKGCALSQASASLLSESVKGKCVSEMKNLSKETVFSLLGTNELSPTRARCALLSLETLQKTLEKNNL
jgi:nitrogen fixation NifU-like protein